MSEQTAAFAEPKTRGRVLGALLILASVSALFYYKWGGSLRSIGIVQATGKLPVSPRALLEGSAISASFAYFAKIWPALAFGVVIGAAVRASAPTALIARWLGGKSTRSTLIGAAAGAPLMLCSCCVTPIFTSVRERGARLSSSLAVMLASPGLNAAAIVLTFALLPTRIAIARVAAALVIVLALSTLIGRWMDSRATFASEPIVKEESPAFSGMLARFAKSLGYLTLVTVPLLALGVLLSGLILPHVTALSGASAALAIVVVALAGTLVALPTFFEIPIAILMLGLGAPMGAVTAFVVAGPIVNLGSLLVVARETRPRIALALAGGVWLVATATGLAVTFFV